MGMAASQARLLTITARLHDVEYAAQSIQHAKSQLATQSDQVYNDYLAALDATTMTVTSINNNGEKSTVTATFNTLFSKNKVRPTDGSIYALKDSRGRLVVEDDVFKGYTEFMSGNSVSDSNLADRFAFYMLGIDMGMDGSDFTDTFARQAEENAYQTQCVGSDNKQNEEIEKLHTKLLELNGHTGDTDYDAIYYTPEDEDKIEEYNTTFAKYSRLLYQNHAEDIYEEMYSDMGETADDFEKDEKYGLFTHYKNIFNQIQASNGCVSIEEFNGPEGDASNNSDWLQNMIESGQMTIHTMSENKNTGEIRLNGTSANSDTSLGTTATTSIDKTALAKAEAKYEHDLKAIDKKDKKFDLDLSKLETERTTLTTEYDSVKKVIEDNIERTFGIFS